MLKPRPVDALLCWPTRDGGGAVLMVRGHTAIRAFKAAGWLPLIHSLDVRFADLSEVRESDIQRHGRYEQWIDGYRSS